jgi:hypothetical protein
MVSFTVGGHTPAFPTVLDRHSPDLLHSVHFGFGAHPVSYPLGTGDYFPGGDGRSVKLTTQLHLVPMPKWWSYTSTPPYVFMA